MNYQVTVPETEHYYGIEEVFDAIESSFKDEDPEKIKEALETLRGLEDRQIEITAPMEERELEVDIEVPEEVLLALVDMDLISYAESQNFTIQQLFDFLTD